MPCPMYLPLKRATPPRVLLKQQRIARRMFPWWCAQRGYNKQGPFRDAVGNWKFLPREVSLIR